MPQSDFEIGDLVVAPISVRIREDGLDSHFRLVTLGIYEGMKTFGKNSGITIVNLMVGNGSYRNDERYALVEPGGTGQYVHEQEELIRKATPMDVLVLNVLHPRGMPTYDSYNKLMGVPEDVGGGGGKIKRKSLSKCRNSFKRRNTKRKVQKYK